MDKTFGLFAAAPRTQALLLLLILLLISFRTFASDSQHMLPLTLEERVREAEVVVEGEVVSQESFWDTRQKKIYTSHIIQVYKAFKGNVKGQQVELITEGGSIGLKKHVLSSALRLNQGQQGMFFLKRQQLLPRSPGNEHMSTMAYGSQQGYVKYNMAEKRAIGVFDSYSSVQELYQRITTQTGQSFRSLARNEALEDKPSAVLRQQQTQNAKLAPVISSFQPTTVSAGTGTVLTINGSGFGTTRGNGAVEFRNADDGGQTYVRPLASEYILWSDTQIRLRVPSTSEDRDTPGSGTIRVVANDGSTFTSATPILIEFAYSNVEYDNKSFRPKLVDRDGSGGYTVRFAPSMRNRQPAQEGFRRAMTTWVCVSGVNWKVGEPTTTEDSEEDDEVVVQFAPISTVGAGVLARTFSYYEGCIVGGVDTVWYVTEFDMEINSNITWQYGPGPPVGNQFDFETVMLHELGHAHQLSHVILPSAIMHYAIEFQRIIRDLSAADVSGANLIVANSVGENVCRVQPMRISTAAECNLAPEIYTLQAAYTSPDAVTVNWTTQNEVQVNNFVVQRSANGSTWQDIGTVEARGSSGNRADLSYTFIDNAPPEAIAYYRLRVVYNGGLESYSPRVRVINPASVRRLSVFPNPINEENNTVTLVYIVEGTATLQAQLYDMSGRLVRDFEIVFRDINLPAELDVADLAAGIYVLKWQERDRSGQVKLLKR